MSALQSFRDCFNKYVLIDIEMLTYHFMHSFITPTDNDGTMPFHDQTVQHFHTTKLSPFIGWKFSFLRFKKKKITVLRH